MILPQVLSDEQKARYLDHVQTLPQAQQVKAMYFLSCLRPLGLFDFASKFCGFKDGGQFHRELCDIADQGPRWMVWMLPRGHFKSSFLTVSEALRRALYYWPNQDEYEQAGGKRRPLPDIGIISWKKGLAEEFVGQIKAICEQPNMAGMFGHAIPADPRKSARKWLNDDLQFNNGARIRAYTLESLPTGFHVTDLFGDDLVTRESVNTGELIDKTREAYSQLLSVLNPDCPFWMVGTRYHFNDLYNHVLKSDDWQSYVQSCYGPDGKPVFHERFTREYLATLEREQGPYTFSCQYLLEPIPSDEQVFRPEWIKMDAPEKSQGGTITICIDPAISMKESACDTGITVVESLPRGNDVHRFLRHRVRRRMNPSEIVECALGLAELYGAHEIGVEAIQYQAAIEHYMNIEMRKRGRYFTVTPIKSYAGRSKYDRIKGLQPEFSRGLYHLRLGEHEDVMEELLSFPQGSKVDVIDSMAMHNELDSYKDAGYMNDPLERHAMRQARIGQKVNRVTSGPFAALEAMAHG